MAIGLVSFSPSGWLPAIIRLTSSRSNQRQSSSSVSSRVIVSEIASQWQPIISEAGKGQGWLAKYRTRPTTIPDSSRVSRRA